jgi:hypothetical protein
VHFLPRSADSIESGSEAVEIHAAAQRPRPVLPVNNREIYRHILVAVRNGRIERAALFMRSEYCRIPTTEKSARKRPARFPARAQITSFNFVNARAIRQLGTFDT